MQLQRLRRLIFPSQCLSCGELIEDDFAFCGPCRRDCWFISGLVCDACGAPLPGEEACQDGVLCDDCLKISRPWRAGRSVFLYRGTGRKLVLALKHGDRTDLVRPMADWMKRAAQPLVNGDPLVVPIPLNYWRFVKRRYNQSALLAQRVSALLGLEYCPDALVRPKRTPTQDGRSVDERFANLQGRLHPHRRHGRRLKGRDVLLIDDVMTSGATLSVASEACFAAGATGVYVLTLARVGKDT